MNYQIFNVANEWEVPSQVFLKQQCQWTVVSQEWSFSLVQSLSRVWLFTTPWIATHQASLSITNSRNPPKPMSIESMMPSNHLILCCPLLLLPSIFPSIRVFSNESALRIRWPKYWSVSFSISLSNEYSGLISFRMDWLGLLVFMFSNSFLKKSEELHFVMWKLHDIYIS